MDDDQTSELEALERILSDPSAEPIMLSYGLLKFITGNFSNEIGSGGFGVVYQGSLQNGKVDVKKISNVHELSDKTFMDEITCLIKAKHKNIVRFLGYCSDTQGEVMEHKGNYVMAEVQKRLLCFEYVPNGNIQNYLEEKLDENEWHITYRIIKGICEGLRYLHALRISHLDLKPENVMLDARMEAKITDFGLARCLVEGQSRVYTKILRGTPGYIAPENINTGEISLKLDLYALGIVIIKLVTRRSVNDFDNWFELSDADNPQMKVCIQIPRACVDVNQDERPTVAEIIRQLNEIENMIQDLTDATESSTNQTTFTTKKNYGRGEWEAQCTTPQRTPHGLQTPDPPSNTLFSDKISYHELAEIVEQARRREEDAKIRDEQARRTAETSRLRDLNALKGHIESVVRFKVLDIDTIEQNYTV